MLQRGFLRRLSLLLLLRLRTRLTDLERTGDAMRIGASGWMAGMSALLLATVKAPVEAAESAPGSVSGSVKSASPKGVRVSVRGAPDVQLRMKPRTVVMVKGGWPA